jgi:hypothetical protein
LLFLWSKKTRPPDLPGIPPAYKYLDTKYDKLVFMDEDFKYHTISKNTMELIYDISYGVHILED